MKNITMNLDFEASYHYYYFCMRLLSLFLIFNVALCYSGVCEATGLNADSAKETSSHCDMVNHGAGDSSDESQVFIQDVSNADSQNSHCCYEVLTNSSVDDNLAGQAFDVLYLLDFPASIKDGNSKTIDLIITKSTHDPPDICLSVSSFLL